MYPAPFLRLVVSGTLFTSETYSWGLSLVPTDPEGQVTFERFSVVPQTVIDALATFHVAAGLSTAAKMTMVKLNEIGTDGRYTHSGSTTFHEWTTPVSGTGTPTMPPQVSQVVTLRTARTRGLAHAGRFYLPKLTGAIQNDGRLAVGEGENQAEKVRTLIGVLNGVALGHRVGVASNQGDGAFEPVTHVEVGRVLDTMRSRRASLREDYETSDPIV